MISHLEIEKRNLESSLLFMQQEHANTLRALHEEISTLQKRCTDLTFDLTMRDDNVTDPTEQERILKITELESLLKASESKHQELRATMTTKDELIADLKSQVRVNERKFLNELKMKDQQVLALKVELDNKGGSIAYLTTEMHKLKVLQQKSDIPGEALPQSPPSADQPSKRRSRRLPSASDIRSRPVTAKGSMPRPDAEVFLTRTVPVETEPESVSVKPTPPVLPPITGDDVSRRAFNSRQQMLRRRLDLKSQPEYTKLAVDKLASNSNTWVHEPDATTK